MNNELPNGRTYTYGPPKITVSGSRGGYLGMARLRVLDCCIGGELAQLADYESNSMEHAMWRNFMGLCLDWCCWVEVATALSVCGIGKCPHADFECWICAMAFRSQSFAWVLAVARPKFFFHV